MELQKLKIILLIFLTPMVLVAQKVSESGFEMKRNYVFIKVRVGDSKPLNFVFDTGAAANVINSRTQKELGLRITRNVQAMGANGPVIVGQISDQSISIGGKRLMRNNIYSTDLSPFEEKLGVSIDGIIGHQLLLKYVIKVDYDQNLISFYSNDDHPDLGIGKVIPVSWSTGAPIINAQVRIHNEIIEGKFILDTGMNGSISINTPFVKKYQLRRKGKTVSHTTQGLGNADIAYLARMSELKIDDFEFKDFVSELNDGNSGVASGGIQVGLIGNGVWRRFNIVFNYRGSVIRVSPNAYYSKPFPVNHVGFVLKASKGNELVVDEVLTPESVNEAIKSGVKLVSINGKEMHRRDLLRIHDMITRPGEPLEMTFQINGQPKKFSIPRKQIL